MNEGRRDMNTGIYIEYRYEYRMDSGEARKSLSLVKTISEKLAKRNLSWAKTLPASSPTKQIYYS